MRHAWLSWIALSAIACGAKPGAQQPLAQHGILRLANSPHTYSTVNLDGEWDFYRGKHIAPKQIAAATPEPITVPGVWNNPAQKPLPGYGIGTYRLRIIFADAAQGAGLSLLLPSISTSYKLFVNGNLVNSVGIAGENKATSTPAFRTQIIRLPAAPAHELVFHVSNFSHRDGGIWNSIQIGGDAAIENRREQNLFGDFFLAGAIFIMAIYHLVLFMIRRNDASPLWFGIFCMLIASHIFFISEFAGFNFFPGIPWETGIRFVYIIWPLALVTFTFYATRIFPAVGFGQLYRMLKLTPLIFVPLFLVLPFEYIPYADLSMEAVTGGVMLVGLYIALRTLMRRRFDALIYLGGFVVFIACYAVDALATNHVIYLAHSVMPAGLLTFLIAQSYLLAKRFAEAERANALKDKFVALVSHDLRSPVIGMRQVLKILPGLDSVREKEQFHELIAAGEKSMTALAEMIEQVLDLTRVQSGKIQPLIVATDLAAAVRAAEAKIALHAKDKEIQINLSLPEKISTCTDTALFTQSLQNLLHNAVKFCMAGDSVSVTYSFTGAIHHFAVSDTGPGISSELIGHLFRADVKTSMPGTAGEVGNGLGLPLAQEMIAALGGKISVTSVRGEGTTFTVTLPHKSAP